VAVEHGVELVDPSVAGRRYEVARRVHLNDTDARGVLRIDALARFLQDVATDDAHDAGRAHNRGVWVLRRIDMIVLREPVLYDTVTLLTFCSGTGPAWAERRTRVTDAAGDALAEAVAVWVYIDRDRGRPLALDDEFTQWYGEAAANRRVSGKLHLPAPPADAASRGWTVRASDFDVLDHVNNVRSFEAVVDELRRRLPGLRVEHATVEYRGTLERDESVELRSTVSRLGDGLGDRLDAWLLVDGEVRVSARLVGGVPLH
jgi:acyl-ACP thioesterase